MIPIIGPIVAALGGALGVGAAGGAATGIGALLSNAWLPALGTGIGTLLTGGSGKDALRNAALAGGGSMLFPGMGKNLSGGIAQLMGIGGKQISGPTDMGMAARFAPPRRPEQTSASTMTAAAPAAATAGSPAIGADIQERRRSTVPGISALSTIPLDPRLQGLPEIPEIQSGGYQSPYGAMMREEQDRRQRAGEDLLLYAPETLYPSDTSPSPLDRSLDLMYQGYGENKGYFSGQVDPSIAKELPFIDPYTMKRYATKADRDAAMEQSMAYSEKGAPLKNWGAHAFATGGEIEGPGTGTSDSVPATIYQDGKPVKDAALSDGEFVMTAKAVRGIGNGSRERGVTRMYELMRRFENGEMA
jgi:hypothetical protein